MTRWLYILILVLLHGSSSAQENYFYTNNGEVSFRSEARLELIKATSTDLRGVLDPEKRTYVFKVLLRTFEGFNSALQQEHFNEKYLESESYPEATFSGKIIEEVDFTKDGEYEVRAKGKLTIHGVAQERIIKCNMTINGPEIKVDSKFSVLLSEHNIKVPKVVHEKIASEIFVDVKTSLSKKLTP